MVWFRQYPNYRAELTEKSEYRKDRAEECRILAELFRDRDAKKMMLQVSSSYTRLASKPAPKRAKRG
jgi:hypothetical protein